jgi:hypothetical protein
MKPSLEFQYDDETRPRSPPARRCARITTSTARRSGDDPGGRRHHPHAVLMWSSIVHPCATVYPDSDKVGIWIAPGSEENLMAPRSAKVGYYFGEV